MVIYEFVDSMFKKHSSNASTFVLSINLECNVNALEKEDTEIGYRMRLKNAVASCQSARTFRLDLRNNITKLIHKHFNS